MFMLDLHILIFKMNEKMIVDPSPGWLRPQGQVWFVFLIFFMGVGEMGKIERMGSSGKKGNGGEVVGGRKRGEVERREKGKKRGRKRKEDGRERGNQGELAWERKLVVGKLSQVPGESLSSLIRFFLSISGIISLLTHG